MNWFNVVSRPTVDANVSTGPINAAISIRIPMTWGMNSPMTLLTSSFGVVVNFMANCTMRRGMRNTATAPDHDHDPIEVVYYNSKEREHEEKKDDEEETEKIEMSIRRSEARS